MKVFALLRCLRRAFLKKDEYAQYVLAESLTRVIYAPYKFSEFGRLFLEDQSFLKDYERFERQNHRSLDRKYVAYQMAKLVKHIEGDTAECGVYQGATSFLICKQMRDCGKTHHIFDSFAGLSAPGSHDGAYWQQGDLSAGEEVVRANLKDFSFVEYHPGWVPDKFAEVAEKRFCYVHIDMDLYRPTLDSLAFFYPRMTPGGIIICDDYGFRTCPGAQKAMDSFFADKAEEIVCLPTGQAFVLCHIPTGGSQRRQLSKEG